MSRITVHGNMSDLELLFRLIEVGLTSNGHVVTKKENHNPCPFNVHRVEVETELSKSWINLGLDKRDRRGVGKITFPHHDMEDYVRNKEKELELAKKCQEVKEQHTL